MSRTSPSYRAAPAAIYSNGRFVDGAADSPAIGCHFLLPHGSGAIRSRSNAIAASHTVRGEVTIFGLSEPSFVLPYPNAAHPHHGEEKGRRCVHTRQNARKRGAHLEAWEVTPPEIPRLLLRGVAASRATTATPTGPRTTATATDTRAAAWLKNVQETSNAVRRGAAAAQTAAAAGAAR
ncbi:hypothetical protein BJV78DRAFT_1332430 [Lactifluus subvellereus]|nr:hypothetical protein BJV78DRAFT_1332430 [Lactifluus subvellereus]